MGYLLKEKDNECMKTSKDREIKHFTVFIWSRCLTLKQLLPACEAALHLPVVDIYMA